MQIQQTSLYSLGRHECFNKMAFQVQASSAPAAHHVGCILAQPSEAKILEVRPLVGLVRDDLAVALLAAQIQSAKAGYV